jgi:hypothetical protein
VYLFGQHEATLFQSKRTNGVGAKIFCVACVVVNFRNRYGRLSSVCTGDSVFQACSRALEVFERDFWKGSKPGPQTILECYAMETGTTYRVGVARVIQWRRERGE